MSVDILDATNKLPFTLHRCWTIRQKDFLFLIKQQFVGVGCVAIKKVRLTPPIIGFVRKSVKHRAQRNHPPETCLFANNAEMPLHETANRVLRRKVYCCVVA